MKCHEKPAAVTPDPKSVQADEVFPFLWSDLDQMKGGERRWEPWQPPPLT